MFSFFAVYIRNKFLNSTFKRRRRRKLPSFRLHFPGKGGRRQLAAHACRWTRKCWSGCSLEAARLSLCFHRERKIKMQLHFSSDAVPDSVCSDFQNLNKFTEQVTRWAAVRRVSNGWSAVEPNRTEPPRPRRVQFSVRVPVEGPQVTWRFSSPVCEHVRRVTVMWHLSV